MCNRAVSRRRGSHSDESWESRSSSALLFLVSLHPDLTAVSGRAREISVDALNRSRDRLEPAPYPLSFCLPGNLYVLSREGRVSFATRTRLAGRKKEENDVDEDDDDDRGGRRRRRHAKQRSSVRNCRAAILEARLDLTQQPRRGRITQDRLVN